MSDTENKTIARTVRGRNIAVPIVIGLAVVGWLLARDFDPAVFGDVRFGLSTALWLLAAVLFMAGRDAGYVWRLRALSRRALSWRQSLRVIMLWEFTSAVTPGAVGGTSVATLYIHKEGMSVGRSGTVVLLTSVLDELYFAVMFPLLVLIIGPHDLFHAATEGSVLERGIMVFALVGYFLKLVWLLGLSYGLFINPRGLKRLLGAVFRLPVLRRWREGAARAGDEIVSGSAEIRGCGARYWAEAVGSTFLSWSSRYLVANALVMAFFGVSDGFLLFARQLVLWVVMLVMPTPGGSGFAEYLFTAYCSDLILAPPDMLLSAGVLIAMLWRLVTYYPYLIVGAFLVPRWLGRNFSFGRRKPEKKRP